MANRWATATMWLLAVMCAAAPATAQEWVRASVADNGTIFEIDTRSQVVNGDVVESWQRQTNLKAQRDKTTGKPYLYETIYRFDDCANRKSLFRKWVHRDRNDGFVSSGPITESWQPISPGTVGEMAWRVACAAVTPPEEKALLADMTAGEWLELGQSQKKDFTLEVLMDQIVPTDDGIALIVTRSVNVAPVMLDDLPIKYIITANAVDCQTKRHAALGSDFFMSTTARVKSLRLPMTDIQFEPVMPGSFIDNGYARICAKAAVVAQARAAEQESASDMSTGTAWGVAKGYLVTSSHVITDARNIEVYQNSEKVGTAKVVADDPANDVAILRFTPSTPGRILTLPLAPKAAALGRSVFTLGYPSPGILGQAIKMTAGQVSSTSGMRDDARHLQVSVPVQPGNSGGPLLGWDGTVLGVVKAKLLRFSNDKNDTTPENVNYVLKTSYIRPMLEDLPDLANYVTLTPGLAGDDLVAQARKAVFMLVVSQ